MSTNPIADTLRLLHLGLINNQTIAPGTPLQGGFYVGQICVGQQLFGLIVAPLLEGEPPNRMAWGPRGKDVQGAISFSDGTANTKAMAEAGSELAQWIQAQTIDGFSDWYLPSRDELELLYRHLKPTAAGNAVYRYGDNPSSIPPGYPYSESAPAQTHATAFREGGTEALDDAWYWSSTQCSAYFAWYQYFGDGLQTSNVKAYEGRARALRRFLIE